jgi:hypothetical protein
MWGNVRNFKKRNVIDVSQVAQACESTELKPGTIMEEVKLEEKKNKLKLYQQGKQWKKIVKILFLYSCTRLWKFV